MMASHALGEAARTTGREVGPRPGGARQARMSSQREAGAPRPCSETPVALSPLAERPSRDFGHCGDRTVLPVRALSQPLPERFRANNGVPTLGASRTTPVEVQAPDSVRARSSRRSATRSGRLKNGEWPVGHSTT
jgi:hypothetical protein